MAGNQGKRSSQDAHMAVDRQENKGEWTTRSIGDREVYWAKWVWVGRQTGHVGFIGTFRLNTDG